MDQGHGSALLWLFLAARVRCFSVSQSRLEAVLQYVQKQEEHHRSCTFQEEYRELLREHKIEFDEQYAWD